MKDGREKRNQFYCLVYTIIQRFGLLPVFVKEVSFYADLVLN